jgi:ComF family protein
MVCWRCRDWPPELTAIAAVRYQGVAEAIVRTIKYSGWRHLADICAEKMADTIRFRDRRLDLLVPVPLHPLRYRERGFNQARLIADRLATRIDRPVVNALERLRTTPPQVGLGRADRVANVSGAFARRSSLESSATVGLIDDVATSGATLHSAASALIAGGTSRVVGVTFALATDRKAE